MIRAVTSGSRNAELVLVAAAIAFVTLGVRALELTDVALPEVRDRIVIQFAATVLAGHLLLRLFAPEAPAQVYAIAMLLAAIGMVFVLRLAPDEAQDQVNWITVGVVFMGIGAFGARWYRQLRRYRYTAAAISLALLMATGVLGDTINGARLWITVGGQSVQTTELIKVGLVVFLAGYLADEASVLSMPRLRFGNRTYTALPYLLPLILTWAAMLAALALLKDLGSVALLLLLAVSAVYLATGRVMYLAAGAVVLVSTGALGYVLFDHAQLRIDTWLDPLGSPLGSGYQTTQAMFAIQAGGITGAGPGLGQADVIPAVATDYVFSAIAEELGLAGALAVVTLFGLFVVAGLRVSLRTEDPFGRMLTACIALLIGIQAAVIIAGNLRLIPTTGITLPMVSYGGSSVVVNLFLVGLLMGIAHDAVWQSRRQGI